MAQNGVNRSRRWQQQPSSSRAPWTRRPQPNTTRLRVGDIDESLGIDAASSQYLGAWFEMAFAALHAVAADPESVDASEPQLWPGHFDAAIEVGDEDHRASYGASPGDHAIDEPYLYVSAWWPDKIGLDTTDAFWNAPNFAGSMLKLSDFATGVDPIDVATNFWQESRNKLG